MLVARSLERDFLNLISCEVSIESLDEEFKGTNQIKYKGTLPKVSWKVCVEGESKFWWEFVVNLNFNANISPKRTLSMYGDVWAHAKYMSMNIFLVLSNEWNVFILCMPPYLIEMSVLVYVDMEWKSRRNMRLKKTSNGFYSDESLQLVNGF